MTKQTEFRNNLINILSKYGAEESIDEVIEALKKLRHEIEVDNPVYQKLKKWLVGKGYEATKMPTVNRLWKKYGEKICKRVLSDNACTSEYRFIQLAEYHLKKA